MFRIYKIAVVLKLDALNIFHNNPLLVPMNRLSGLNIHWSNSVWAYVEWLSAHRILCI